MTSKRLEYVDAMRGFTMMLVVYSHIIAHGYHAQLTTFNTAFIQFRMPLFFFISGFVLYNSQRVWDSVTASAFLKKKFMVQIVPTLFFLLVYDFVFDRSVSTSLMDNLKQGYWFTITLFNFFFLNVTTEFVAHKLHDQTGRLKKILIALEVMTILVITFCTRDNMPVWCADTLSVFCGFQLMHYPFFLLGIFVKKHFQSFRHATDNDWLLAIVLFLFFASVFTMKDIFDWMSDLTNGSMDTVVNTLFKYFNGTLGVVIVFTFFRKKENLFSKENAIGRALQFVGRRTLDVYLLHYFFLPYHLQVLGKFFKTYSNPSVEFVATLLLSLIVLSLTLCMSSILRMSGVCESHLFGVKKK